MLFWSCIVLSLLMHSLNMCVTCPETGHTLTRSVTARVPTHEDETHEDFKPKFNPEAEPRSAPTVEDQIKEDINHHSVFLYMKVATSSTPTLTCTVLLGMQEASC